MISLQARLHASVVGRKVNGEVRTPEIAAECSRNGFFAVVDELRHDLARLVNQYGESIEVWILDIPACCE